MIANNIILDKVILASSKTMEAMIKEQIEMNWMDIEASYLMEVKNNPNINKEEYFKEHFKLNDGTECKFDFKNQTVIVTVFYKNKSYQFIISQNGKATYITDLKGNVKVGDYIDYPVEYTDIYSQIHYTKENGWRVIDDGKMKGTTGQVRIISTGIPAKWYYDPEIFENGKVAVDALLNDFEQLELQSNSISFFKVEPIAEKITTISLKDFNNAYNEIYNTKREANDISALQHKNELFYVGNKAYYWLATNSIENDKNIYFVAEEEIREDSDLRNGIRPVICLKENITGIFESGIWKIIE